MTDTITVTVTETRGSAPREVGASMTIRADAQCGTIGGGALEWHATKTAREMLVTGRTNQQETLPLGPNLGQCCGGSVTLDYSTETNVTKKGYPLWIWGAGHVGRAVVTATAPLPAFAITWADTAEHRFPSQIPETVSPLIANNLSRAIKHVPQDAHHLILTYSHNIDLALCDALLRHGFTFAGLIGSNTKWARFRKRLADMGHADAQIARITCPIGDPKLGKHPAAIALGVASQLLTLPGSGESRT